MPEFHTVTVGPADDGLRLDRWFKLHFPAVGFGELQKLLRTGQVRVDGKRAKPGLRLDKGQEVRVPPRARTAPGPAAPAKPRETPLDAGEARALRARVLYRDNDIIVIDKPAGLAVQGGTGTRRHLDAMLDALRFGAEDRPRLVHRLDRDTSGILVLARHRAAARELTGAFKARRTRKIYLAVTVGVPRPRQGKIDLALGKAGGRGREKMTGEPADGRRAVTLFSVLDAAGQKAALVTLMPETGRTHQLRAHMAAIGTPILGDGKYGGRAAFIGGLGLEKRLHLHARRLEIPKPSGGILVVEAPLPGHLATAIEAFGFTLDGEIDPFPRA